MIFTGPKEEEKFRTDRAIVYSRLLNKFCHANVRKSNKMLQYFAVSIC